MNRDRIILALLGLGLSMGMLACRGSNNDSASTPPAQAPNPAVQQITSIALTKPDDTEPVNVSTIDLSLLDPENEGAFDSIFK